MALAGIRFPLRNSCRASSPLPETTSSVSAKARPPSRGRRKSSKARSSLPLKGKGTCPPSEGMTRGGIPGMRTEQPNPVPGPMAAITLWPEDGFMSQWRTGTAASPAGVSMERATAAKSLMILKGTGAPCPSAYSAAALLRRTRPFSTGPAQAAAQAAQEESASLPKAFFMASKSEGTSGTFPVGTSWRAVRTSPVPSL